MIVIIKIKVKNEIIGQDICELRKLILKLILFQFIKNPFFLYKIILNTKNDILNNAYIDNKTFIVPIIKFV